MLGINGGGGAEDGFWEIGKLIFGDVECVR